MHHSSAGLRDSTRGARVTRAAPHPGRKPPPDASPGGRAPPAAPPRRCGREVDVLLACAYYPNLGHVCARTDWYVRVVGQPQSLRNPPGRWRRSPGMTRRCSRSRCRRSLGSMPVSHCTCSPLVGDVADAESARRRATHSSEDARPAPACGTRSAPGREHIIAATAAARHADAERAPRAHAVTP